MIPRTDITAGRVPLEDILNGARIVFVLTNDKEGFDAFSLRVREKIEHQGQPALKAEPNGNDDWPSEFADVAIIGCCDRMAVNEIHPNRTHGFLAVGKRVLFLIKTDAGEFPWAPERALHSLYIDTS